MSRKFPPKTAGLAGLVVVLNAVVLFTGWTPARYPAALLLLFVLPGWAWAELILPATVDWLERAAMALGLSFALSGLATLAVHYWPGPVTAGALLAASDALIAVPLVARALSAGIHPRAERAKSLRDWISARRASLFQPGGSPPGDTAQTTPIWPWLLALLAVTLFFRLANLGYSEFQGDEALVMLSAAEAIDGRQAALFTHGKAPAEVLIPMGVWPLTGTISEPLARFPFALAGTVGVLAVYLLGRRMFNERVGLMAGALLAINGFFVGFGRIVQYQSLVFGMTALALYCYYRWYADDEPRYQLPGALFLAFGLLSHLDAVLALPAVGVLYLAKWWPARTTDRKISVTTFALSIALFAAALALFYVPFARDPQFARTFGYVAGSRVGNQMLTNTLGSFFTLSTVYNSTYYFAALFLLLAVLVGRELSRLTRWPWLAPALFVAASLSVLLAPRLWQWGQVNASVVPFALTLLALYAARHTSVELKTALTWFAAPFVVYTFIVEYPLTHVYNIYPALCLLAAVAMQQARGKRQEAPYSLLVTRYSLLITCLSLFVIFSYYVYFMFVSHTPEYRRTYPAHRNPWYWTAYDELPAEGYFGFPYRAGWKVIGQLYAEGTLRGDYGSNEEAEVTAWYTRRAVRSCYPDPDYYFIAENVQDAQPVPADTLAGYALTGRVLVDDEPKLSIYQRQAAAATNPITYRLPDYAAAFDRAARPEVFAGRVTIGHPLDVNLGHRVRLLGYDLEAGSWRLEAENQNTRPEIRLTLYWQATTRMDKSYHVFVHLETDRIWGQADGIPACNLYPTNLWRVGQVVPDRYRVPIDPATPPGDYELLVGLYEPDTGQRLEVIDPAGNPQGNSVPLATVTIGP